MSSPEPALARTRRVVFVSLVTQILETGALAAAAAITGSSALVSQSFAAGSDIAVQLFLVLGVTLSARPADETHPLGYGRERYFWSLFGALAVFVSGFAVATEEALRGALHPAAVSDYGVGYAVLGVSLVFETVAFLYSLREVRARARARQRTVLAYLRATTEPATSTELIGNTIGLAGGILATTAGFSGAQLAELLNEAAIMAARERRTVIESSDVREGLRRVLAGPKRRSAPIGADELEKIAYHEAGHVVCAELCEHHENAQHVTIDPRGNAMGFALFAQEDRALHDEEHLREAMIAALGGRAAEELVFGRVSSGAKNDLEKVNAIARAAVTEYGMSERLGPFIGNDHDLSNQTKAVIDREVERLVARAYREALSLLDGHRRQLEALAKRLLEARELERLDIATALA
jgi:hypothetical protein